MIVSDNNYINLHKSSRSHDDIINFENHAYDFGGQSQGTGCNQRRLEYFFISHVNNRALFYADPRMLFAFAVFVPQLSNYVYGVHSCIFGQSEGNNL